MVTPGQFARELGLEILSSGGEKSVEIDIADMCHPGLQFAGYFEVFANMRPQLIGKTEMAYFLALPAPVRKVRLQRYFSYPMPCIVIARGMECPEDLLASAKEHGVPVYRTQEITSQFSGRAISYLGRVLAPRKTCHGVMMDLFGVGVLITGESGIGKSECALELIKRGHALISDDVVDISRVGQRLYAEAPEMVRDFMELRGIGIVDIKSIFGIGAVERTSAVDIVIELEPWSSKKNYDRLGVEKKTTKILDLDIPLIELPIRSGRNLAIIVEIAVRNWRLNQEGYSAINELDRRLSERFGIQNDIAGDSGKTE